MSGIVIRCTEKDVLMGRGKRVSEWPGNIYFRQVILNHRDRYNNAERSAKVNIARDVLTCINKIGGRFLKENDDGTWTEVDRTRAVEKTCQALREKDKGASSNNSNNHHHHPPAPVSSVPSFAAAAAATPSSSAAGGAGKSNEHHTAAKRRKLAPMTAKTTAATTQATAKKRAPAPRKRPYPAHSKKPSLKPPPPRSAKTNDDNVDEEEEDDDDDDDDDDSLTGSTTVSEDSSDDDDDDDDSSSSSDDDDDDSSTTDGEEEEESVAAAAVGAAASTPPSSKIKAKKAAAAAAVVTPRESSPMQKLRALPQEDMMKRLVHFKRAHGHAAVPMGWSGDAKLADWCAAQRQSYREVSSGYRSATDAERSRFARLKREGFVWDFDEWHWEGRYGELAEWVEKNAGCKSAEEFVAPTRECQLWLQDQRRQYRQQQRGVASFPRERIGKLKKIGILL